MQSKTPLLMVTALVCGLGAAFGTWRLVSGAQTAPAAEEVKIKVLAPIADVAPYTLFSDTKKFQEIEVPKNKLRESEEDTIKSFDQVKGRLSRHYKLKPNEPIYKNDLCDNADNDIENRLKKGERAVAMRVTPDDAGGGFLAVGNRVDIVATMAAGTSSGNNSMETRYILENIELLAVDNMATRDPAVQITQTNRLVLRLTNDQALVFKNFQDTSRLSVYKRRTDDTDIVGDAKSYNNKKTLPGAMAASKSDEETLVTNTLPTKVETVNETEYVPPAKVVVQDTGKGTMIREHEHKVKINDGGTDRTKVYPDVKIREEVPVNKNGENKDPKKDDTKKDEGTKNDPGN